MPAYESGLQPPPPAAASANHHTHPHAMVQRPKGPCWTTIASGRRSGDSTASRTHQMADVWLEAHTAEGVPYYYNTVTGESAWVPPDGVAVSAAAAAAGDVVAVVGETEPRGRRNRASGGRGAAAASADSAVGDVVHAGAGVGVRAMRHATESARTSATAAVCDGLWHLVCMRGYDMCVCAPSAVLCGLSCVRCAFLTSASHRLRCASAVPDVCRTQKCSPVALCLRVLVALSPLSQQRTGC
jgi:hypothetical protein